ncbi:hypothetical protein HOLleu_31973 [Holothuria leucospilota]|uniref:Uncharacterized protein n=1 Tax=Holothuria leucospilota TaxID=206669 RepID=A0A9Q0YQZ8_HOLLE|nr:hypothetical protein HOLleu_31973 [Holothuria leucospilota]
MHWCLGNFCHPRGWIVFIPDLVCTQIQLSPFHSFFKVPLKEQKETKRGRVGTHQASKSSQLGKDNAVEGRSINYKKKGNTCDEKKSLPSGTQQLLTRFHSLNLHDPLVLISPPASPSDDHVVNHRCSCGNIGVSERTASHLSDSSQSDDEEEGEDNSLTVQQILSMLIAAEVKGHISPSKASVLKNLASSCNSEDRVSDVYLRQFVKLISSQLDLIVSISLKVLSCLANSKENCEKMLGMNVYQIVIHLIEYNQSDMITESSFQFLKEILKHKDLKDAWLEHMIIDGLQILMGYVTKESLHLLHSEEVSSNLSAVSWLLSECAAYQELAVLMLDQFVPQLTSLVHMNAALQEPVLMMICNIASHNDFTNSALLHNKRLLQQTAHTLAKGSCSVQKTAISLYTQLISTGAGLNHFLGKGEEDDIKTFFSVMKATHCRKVCHEGCKFLLKILSNMNYDQWKVFLSHCQEALSDQTRVRSNLSSKAARNEKTSELSTRSREGRFKSSLEEFCKLMMQMFYAEGKFDIANKEIKAVRFKPGTDSCQTLHLIIKCFIRIVGHVTYADRDIFRQAWSVKCGSLTSDSVTHMSIIVPILSATRVTKRSLNQNKKEAKKVNYHADILIIVQINVLHLIALLNSFSVFQNCCLHQLPREPQKNIETLYLQASLKIWQSQGVTKLFPLTLTSEEKLFVTDLLELCFTLAHLSCTMWNSDFNNLIEESASKDGISQETGRGQKQNIEHYYLQNIAEAFQPSKIRRNKICKDPVCTKCEVSGAKRHGKKLAWGSDPLKQEERQKGEKDLGRSWRGDGLLVSDVKKDVEDEKRLESLEKERIDSGYGIRRKGKLIRSNRGGITVKNRFDKVRGDVLIDEKGDRKDEISKFQKILRKKLIKAGLVEAVCPWVSCEDSDIQLLALSVLRCLLLPWYPEEIQNYCRSLESKRGVLGTQQIRVQQMADSLAERDKLLSEVLQQVSSQTAGIITDALAGQRSNSSSSKSSEKRKNQDAQGITWSPCGSNITISKEEPLSFQIALWSIEILGSRVSLVLQQASGDALKECLFVVHDLSTFGEVTIHLKLASVGVLSALIEVATKLCQEPQITLIALKTLRVLVQDLRMKQLFLGEGGHIFLQQLVSSGEAHPAICQEVKSLLSTVSHGKLHLVHLAAEFVNFTGTKRSVIGSV